MKKKITAVALIVALLAVAVIGTTLAYFTDTKSATNTFTVGNVKIDLTESKWVEPKTVEPGIEYAKNPVVKNTGKNDAYVRMDVTLSDWAAFKAAAATHGITDLSTIFGGYSANWERYAITENGDNTVTYSYLYNTKVAAGASTDPIFTSVTVPAAFTSDEMKALGENFTIDVDAFAIQANGTETELIAELKAMTK